MGLGILFIGYFISTIVAIPFPEIGALLGYLLMGYALTKLSQYEKWFSYARLAAFAVLIITLPSAVVYVTGLFGMKLSLPEILSGSAFTYIDSVLELLFHVALYLSVLRLATSTCEEKLRLSSARNCVFYCMLFIADTAFRVMANFEVLHRFSSMCLLICSLLYILLIVLNHIMLFTAYMWICDEGDIDMEMKDTGIAWFDKLRRKAAENEQKAADDTKAYLQSRYDETQRKKHKKKKKKK